VGDIQVEVRRIRATEWSALRELRLRALAEAPMAFGSTWERESAFPDDVWMGRAADGATGDDRVTFVAERDGRLVGLATGLAAPPGGAGPEVVGMFVDGSARGGGVVEGLLDALAGWARERGAERLQLWVTGTNAAAVRAYARYGFRETGATQPLPHTPSILELQMAYALTAAP